MSRGMYVTHSGTVYHKSKHCTTVRNPLGLIFLRPDFLQRLGFSPCKRCYPKGNVL